MKPDYKNWIPKGMLFSLIAGTVLSLALLLVFGVFGIGVSGKLRVVLGVVFGIAFVIYAKYTEWCVYAYRSFSYDGERKLSKQIIDGTAEQITLPEGGVGLRSLTRRIFGWREARKDDIRKYAAACFGKSMLTPAELADAERTCCTGHHRGCVLHFTRGEAPETGEAPTREWEQIQEQTERNRAYFQAHFAQNRLEIQRLAQQLQNTILLLQEDGSLRCRAGRVNPALAWRAPSLGDGRVFDRQQPNTLGDLIVDILLDASASQNRRQEQLATQGYILAEALTRCAIPVRVLSYCSVSGCTVLREYLDYRENQGNNRIFEFAAAGWNRDGLALRAVDWLLRRSGEQQRLLLILTDANPNDDTRLPGTGNQVFSRDYSGRPAVADAAEEATALRRHGNPPLCLFSGREGDLSSARTIYGRDVVRLPSVGWFAQTVGKIIQGRLQALES